MLAWLCTCVHACTWIRECLWRSEVNTGCLLPWLSTFILRLCLSLNVKLIHLARLVVSRARDLSLLFPPCQEHRESGLGFAPGALHLCLLVVAEGILTQAFMLALALLSLPGLHAYQASAAHRSEAPAICPTFKKLR